MFHGLRLTGSHDPSYTANTVGLWLHSSGNGLHKKKEANPHVGTRPGLWHVDGVKKTKKKNRWDLDLLLRTPGGHRVNW